MSTAGPVPAPSPIQPQDSSSPIMRVLQTIYAPSKAYSGLKPATDWIIPLIIMAILSLVFVYAVDKKVGFDTVQANQMKMSPKAAERMERLPEAQREQQMRMAVTITRFASYGAFLFIGIWSLIIALVLWGTFSALGARVGFGSSFSIVMLSWIPGVFKTILATVVLFAGIDPEGFSIQNTVATNLGVIFDPINSRFLYSLGSAIDIFMIWTLIVAAIGFSVVGKVKKSTAFMVIFGWYAVVTLVGAGLGALFA